MLIRLCEGLHVNNFTYSRSFFRPTNWFLSSSTRSDSDIRVLSSDLLSAKGEVSGATIARQILNQYRELEDEGKLS